MPRARMMIGAAPPGVALFGAASCASATSAPAGRRLAAIQRQYGTDSVADVRKNAQKAAKEQAKIQAEQVAATQKATADMQAAFKEHFDQAGSTISSDLLGVIEHTKNFGNIAQAVAKNITSQFLNAGVKVAANWAATQAFNVARTVIGQAQTTTAVTAGQAAQTAAVTAGQGAQAGVVGAGMVKNILGSSAEAEAGTFGFLAPILGPAAAGPAAAVQALVAGFASLVPSFATGSWRLPSDTLAQVHAGEMIVPAGPAGAMRAALSGSGGGGGGDVHHHHYNMSFSALDTRGLASFVKRNGKELAQGAMGAKANGSFLYTK